MTRTRRPTLAAGVLAGIAVLVAAGCAGTSEADDPTTTPTTSQQPTTPAPTTPSTPMTSSTRTKTLPPRQHAIQVAKEVLRKERKASELMTNPKTLEKGYRLLQSVTMDQAARGNKRTYRMYKNGTWRSVGKSKDVWVAVELVSLKNKPGKVPAVIPTVKLRVCTDLRGVKNYTNGKVTDTSNFFTQTYGIANKQWPKHKWTGWKDQFTLNLKTGEKKCPK